MFWPEKMGSVNLLGDQPHFLRSQDSPISKYTTFIGFVMMAQTILGLLLRFVPKYIERSTLESTEIG